MKVHDSQAYRKMCVTREHISRILELREMLLSFQTGFNLVNAAVVCAILESISGFEPSSVILLEACDSLKLLSIYFDLCVDATGVVCHQLGLLGTDLHAVGCGGFVLPVQARYYASHEKTMLPTAGSWHGLSPGI